MASSPRITVTAADDPRSRKVEHNYVDHSNEVDTGYLEDAEGNPTHASDRNFPVKLHYMLSELESDGQDHIISWAPHGRCFVVHDQEEFVRSILPMWFRQTKFASFQRQLNLYGFKRLTTGRDKKGYYHELFLRSRRFLSHRIPRIKLKGTGSRKPTSPETEPNFYLLPYLPEEKKDPKKNVLSNPADAPMGSIGGLNGLKNGVGLSSFDPLLQASANPASTFNGGLGGFGQLSILDSLVAENPVLVAQSRAYTALALQMPGLTGGLANANTATIFSPGLFPQSHQMLTERDMAMRLALLSGQRNAGVNATVVSYDGSDNTSEKVTAGTPTSA